MPFSETNVKELIEQEKQKSKSFNKKWNELSTIYRLIDEMINIRKIAKISQKDLAEVTGVSQQVISRIESKDNIPTFKTFSNLLNALGYTLKIEKKI